MNNPIQTTDQNDAQQSGETKMRKTKRKRLLLAFGVFFLVVLICYGIWHVFFSAPSESTENAYTAVEVTQITPLISGAIKQVKVVDTQSVHVGDVLLVIDDTDLQIALTQAEASLAHTKRQILQTMANDVSLAGQVDLRSAERRSSEADLTKASAALDKALVDAKRRRALVAEGAVSQEELTDVETRLQEAQAAFKQAQARISAAAAATSAAGGARQANAALIADSTVDNHPDVIAAAARLKQAQLNQQRAIIRSPIDGVVVQRAVETGQHVQVGTRLMSIVPVHQMHVDANFKEGQLREVRTGQPVRLTSDLYGDDVVYKGWIEGVGGGSGSVFSAIPAQNATGNWIKVVQRLPVRIRLDEKQLSEHPLRAGLSMKVTVDLENKE